MNLLFLAAALGSIGSTNTGIPSAGGDGFSKLLKPSSYRNCPKCKKENVYTKYCPDCKARCSPKK